MTGQPPRRLMAIIRKGGLCLLASLALAACDPATGKLVDPPARPITPTPLQPSAESLAVKAYLARVQTGLLAQNMLRTDGGGADTPFDARMLADNFIRIAMFDEYTRTDAGFVQQESVSHLRRWVAPVRIGLNFGASVPPARQATDRARIASYLARLSRLTGHPIALSDTDANFQVFIVNEDERRALGPVIRQSLPAMTDSELAGLTGLPRSNYCVVYAFSSGGTDIYTRAVAVLRAENPDLLSLVCIHEELAQGMGLANDSPKARPSIFNDDQEFALLTRQDELMLKMLYDPRLRPGMTLGEVKPIAEVLANELIGGDS
jgi:Protein of unknown function (DUF2927)